MTEIAGPRGNWLLRARAYLSRHGPLNLLHNLLGKLDNHWYDFREGTSTAGLTDLDRLSISSRNKKRGVYYGATKRRPFAEVLKVVSPPKDCTFVDVGCGKGKVLLMAMDYGFHRVTGIEFAHELCEAARKNVETIRRRRGLKCSIEILECDATDYVVRPQDSVFYMFHPFDDFVMSIFVDNVVASVKSHPRPIWLIYSYPAYGKVIEKCAPFLRTSSCRIRGTPFKVYTNS
jgi:SAM-dependent methyltransferase